MVNYLSKFLPKLSDHTKLFRDLEKKYSLWSWTENHEKQFQEIKLMISTPPVLRYFDIEASSTIQCDAS